MFENFSFGAQSQVQYDYERSASPTDTTACVSIPPAASFSFQDSVLDGIVHKFEQQRLSTDAMTQSFIKWSEPSSPPSEIDSDMDDMAYPTPRSSVSSQSTQNSEVCSAAPVVCRRLQRQLNVQMQCSSSHLRDISSLVEQMIASSSQCQVYEPLSRYNSASSLPGWKPERITVDTNCTVVENGLLTPRLEVDEDIDEGFHEEIFEEVSLRRASTPSGIRKNHGLTFCRSGDFLWDSGKVKVRSKPRMRKRKTTTVRE